MKLTGKLSKESKSLNAAVSPRAGGGRVKDVVYGSASGESLVNPDGVAIIPPYPPMPTIPVKGVMQGQTNLVDNNGIARVPEFPTIPASNKSIFGLTAPDSSVGNNGDVYYELGTNSYYSVDYISTSGGDKTQCINTGVYMADDISIYIKTKVYSTSYANWQAILGFRNNTPFYGLYTRCDGQNKFGIEYNSTNAQIASDAGIYDSVIEINANKNGWNWTDGTNTGSEEAYFSGTANGTLNLGSANFSGAGGSEQGKYNFYEVIFYRSGQEILHLVPAIKDNIAGMIDLLTFEFYKSTNVNNNFTYSGTPTEVEVYYVKNKYVKYNNGWIKF